MNRILPFLPMLLAAIICGCNREPSATKVTLYAPDGHSIREWMTMSRVSAVEGGVAWIHCGETVIVRGIVAVEPEKMRGPLGESIK